MLSPKTTPLTKARCQDKFENIRRLEIEILALLKHHEPGFI